MIGLLFFGVLGIWGLLCLYLGRKIPVWCKFKKFKLPMQCILPIFIFFIPVIDEIIAYQQWKLQCDNMDDYTFYSKINPEDFRNSEVFYSTKSVPVTVSPKSVEVEKIYVGYFEKSTGTPIAYFTKISVRNGFLHIPAGSSGDPMPGLWKGCGPNHVSYSGNIPTILTDLHVNKIGSNHAKPQFNLLMENDHE